MTVGAEKEGGRKQMFYGQRSFIEGFDKVLGIIYIYIYTHKIGITQKL